MALSMPNGLRVSTTSKNGIVARIWRFHPPFRTLWLALVLGWCSDLLFYRQRLSLSVPVFVLLAVGALFGTGRLDGVRPARRNLWLLVPLLFFAAMVAVRANVFLTWLNLVAVVALSGLLVYFYAAGRVERLGLAGYPAVLTAGKIG
ncbi:MAG: hypothetical protein HY332_06795 [Chloroflexi bacterium]|nr:hypothetical protein [Chloroflexota bacterium]